MNQSKYKKSNKSKFSTKEKRKNKKDIFITLFKNNIFKNSIIGFINTTRLYRAISVGVLLYFYTPLVTYSLASIIFLCFSFAFNDYVDHEKDKIAHPDRALPSGLVSRNQSLLLSLFLLIVGGGIYDY